MLHCCEMSVSFSGKRCENALKEQMLAYVGCKISQMCQLLIAFGYGFNKKRTKKNDAGGATDRADPCGACGPCVPCPCVSEWPTALAMTSSNWATTRSFGDGESR